MEYTKAHESRAGALPCLNSNNCITPSPESDLEGGSEAGFSPLARLSTQHRKSAFILKESVQKLADDYCIERLGFLTLTFREHITCPREAQKRFHSLKTNVLNHRYKTWLRVFERQKSGRIHYHLLVVLNSDIRTGINFEELANGKYTSAPDTLRKEWQFWRQTAPKYRFGRTELLPVKSNVEAMAKYVGKYIGKSLECRDPRDKGVRLVEYGRKARAGTTRYQFLSPGSAEWRRKTATFAQIVQEKHPNVKISELSDLSKVLGKRWAYNHREYILALP